MVPVCTVKLVENPPDAFVACNEDSGFVHPTGTALPYTVMVG